jgi:nucleoside-diphosphate-sugar epimerase
MQDWGVPSTCLRPGVVYGVGRDQGMTSKTTVAILAAAMKQVIHNPVQRTRFLVACRRGCQRIYSVRGKA